MSEARENDETGLLLARWYDGDREALARLLEENLAWMHERIQHELAPHLRHKFGSMDLVQDGALRLLAYGPKFKPENRSQFRALLTRILLNLIRDRIGELQARRRDIGREEALPTAVSRVEDLRRSLSQPDEKVERLEMTDWIKLGLEFLEPNDRRVILLRQYDGLEFSEIAARLELSEDAARMRFNRAVARLGAKIKELLRAQQETRTSG